MRSRPPRGCQKPPERRGEPAPAAGEAPENHWTASGTLSYLTEIGTSFQPPYATTLAEEARVWPGVRRFLDFRPAMAGHVRSLFQNLPLEAEVVVPAYGFTAGEKNLSEKTFGRYKVWLPPGNYAVTFKAAGFRDQTVNVNVTAYDQTKVVDVVMIPSFADPTLVKSGTEQIGTPVGLAYGSPGDAGLFYWIPMAFSDTPGTPVGPRVVPISMDPLAIASMSLAPVLVNNLGTLPGSASATATFNIPALPALVGFSFFFDGITFEPGYPLGVKKFSSSVKVTVKP